MESSSSSSSSLHGTLLDHSDLEAGSRDCAVKTHRPPCTRNQHRRVVVGSGMRRNESRFFCDAYSDSHDYGDGHRHFLDACFLCKKPLAGNRDIFMYRGDMPFCSKECRQDQIERDETEEKNSKYSTKATSGKSKQRRQKQSSQRIPVSAW